MGLFKPVPPFFKKNKVGVTSNIAAKIMQEYSDLLSFTVYDTNLNEKIRILILHNILRGYCLSFC